MKMAGEYEDKRLGNEYLELLTDIKTVINYGKYSSQVISDSPDWVGTEGEQLFRYQANGTGFYYYNYFWVNSGWSFLRWVGSSNALVVDDNSVTTAMIQNGAVTGAKLNGYDSGWFGAIAVNTDYEIQHNLGTVEFIANLYVSPSANGINCEQVSGMNFNSGNGQSSGGWVHAVTTSSLRIATGSTDISSRGNAGLVYGGITTAPMTTGYYRIVLLSLA